MLLCSALLHLPNDYSWGGEGDHLVRSKEVRKSFHLVKSYPRTTTLDNLLRTLPYLTIRLFFAFPRRGWKFQGLLNPEREKRCGEILVFQLTWRGMLFIDQDQYVRESIEPNFPKEKSDENI